MRTNRLIILLVFAVILMGCNSYRFYVSGLDFEHSKYGSVYQNLDEGDKIKLQTKDKNVIKCRVLRLENDTLRVEEQNGQIIDIPLTEVDYIRQSKVAVSVLTGILVVGVIAAIVYLEHTLGF